MIRSNLRAIEIPASLALLMVLLLGSPASAGPMFVEPQFGFTTTSNIHYATHPITGGDLALTLDLYRPTGPGLPDQLPAMVLMHGGFFVSGSKTSSTMVTLAREFASRGWVTASINYRKLDVLPPAPGSTLTAFPDRLPDWLPEQLDTWGVTLPQYIDTMSAAVYDQAAAVRWLVDNAATYNIDPEMLAVGGHSAGAVSSLALGAGIVDGVPETNVKAVFSGAGALFGWESAIDANMPGVFLLHGTADTTVPYSEVPHLLSALSTAGVPHDALIVPGGGHSSSSMISVLSANEDRFFQFMTDQVTRVPEMSSLSLLLASSFAFFWIRRRGSRE